MSLPGTPRLTAIDDNAVMAARFGLSAIGQLSLAVGDIEKAVSFYRDKLGLPFLSRTPKTAFFDCGGIRLMLEPSGPRRPGPEPVIYFKVSDLEAAWAELKSRQVIFERDPQLVARLPEHDLWMAVFRDADGNALALMCERTRAL